MTEHNDARSKIVDLVGRAHSAMLTTITGDGDLASRPMAVQKT